MLPWSTYSDQQEYLQANWGQVLSPRSRKFRKFRGYLNYSSAVVPFIQLEFHPCGLNIKNPSPVCLKSLRPSFHQCSLNLLWKIHITHTSQPKHLWDKGHLELRACIFSSASSRLSSYYGLSFLENRLSCLCMIHMILTRYRDIL